MSIFRDAEARLPEELRFDRDYLVALRTICKEERLRFSQLKGEIGVSDQQVRRIAERLRRNKLATIKRADADARGRIIRATEEGRQRLLDRDASLRDLLIECLPGRGKKSQRIWELSEILQRLTGKLVNPGLLDDED